MNLNFRFFILLRENQNLDLVIATAVMHLAITHSVLTSTRSLPIFNTLSIPGFSRLGFLGINYHIVLQMYISYKIICVQAMFESKFLQENFVTTITRMSSYTFKYYDNKIYLSYQYYTEK